jgi:hypothetical protein
MLCILFASPIAFAQSESVQTRFSIGFSLGYPTSVNFSARNVLVKGLGVRAEVGGFYLVFFGYAQFSLNIEYHTAQPEDIGFYAGFGVVAFKDLVPTSSPSMPVTQDRYDWKLGAQIYLGLDVGPLFFEFGITPILDFIRPGVHGFVPRLLLGFHLYF